MQNIIGCHSDTLIKVKALPDRMITHKKSMEQFKEIKKHCMKDPKEWD